MIWSIMPEELIFAATPSGEQEQQSQVVDYCGRKLSIRDGRVEALLSSDPNDYLDRRFYPGATLNIDNIGEQ